ncbi:MAG: hypothetical protein RIS94_1831 [Pseudomonadota bacterium]|jgi:DHA1 family bicyclomycin/chloramphenicol resistance-like MFS transporter
MGHREFVALMAMTMALQALAIDAMLPALGEIARDLHVADPNRRQLVVGVFLVSAGLGALIPGALADRYGRRPVLLGSLLLYIALSAVCALSPDFNTLLIARAAQAIGSAGLSVLPGAIIRDRESGDGMAKLMSTISVVFMLVPMVAPALGQAVLLFAGWRWIFGLLGLMGVLLGVWVALRLPETLRPEYRQPIMPMSIVRNMGAAAVNREAFGYVIGGALTFGALFGYVNSAQQLVGEHFGAGHWFPLIFGATALCMALASFSNSRIVERFGARRVSHTALLAYIGLSIAQTLGAAQAHEPLWQFMPMMMLNMCMVGFIGANFGSISLQPFARTAGAASSVQAFLRMVIGAGLGIVIGQAFNGTALPLAKSFLVCGVLSLLAVLYSEKGKLFRRLNPPGSPRPMMEIH